MAIEWSMGNDISLPGPIYTPLVISAILVAIAWRAKWWIGLPLIVLAGYYAQITRFTWMFAPALWSAMLFLADQSGEVKNQPQMEGEARPVERGRHPGFPMRRLGMAAAAGLAGLVGGYIIPHWSQLASR